MFQVWVQVQAKRQRNTLLTWRSTASHSDTAEQRTTLPSLWSVQYSNAVQFSEAAEFWKTPLWIWCSLIKHQFSWIESIPVWHDEGRICGQGNVLDFNFSGHWDLLRKWHCAYVCCDFYWVCGCRLHVVSVWFSKATHYTVWLTSRLILRALEFCGEICLRSQLTNEVII